MTRHRFIAANVILLAMMVFAIGSGPVGAQQTDVCQPGTLVQLVPQGSVIRRYHEAQRINELGGNANPAIVYTSQGCEGTSIFVQSAAGFWVDVSYAHPYVAPATVETNEAQSICDRSIQVLLTADNVRGYSDAARTIEIYERMSPGIFAADGCNGTSIFLNEEGIWVDKDAVTVFTGTNIPRAPLLGTPLGNLIHAVRRLFEIFGWLL